MEFHTSISCYVKFPFFPIQTILPNLCFNLGHGRTLIRISSFSRRGRFRLFGQLCDTFIFLTTGRTRNGRNRHHNSLSFPTRLKLHLNIVLNYLILKVQTLVFCYLLTKNLVALEIWRDVLVLSNVFFATGLAVELYIDVIQFNTFISFGVLVETLLHV